MIFPECNEPVKQYKPYKAIQFNKKLEKARMLINSIDDTSLKPDDKKLLLAKIKAFVADY